MSGFDINRSRVGKDKLSEFLMAPLSNDLNDIPGVGPSTIEKLKQFDIYNPYQLVGCFLRVCGENMTSEEHLDAFWYYLKVLNVPGGTRSTIVHAISEKVYTLMPSIRESVAVVSDGGDKNVDGFMIPDLVTDMERTYLVSFIDAYPTAVPDCIVYDSLSFKLMKQLARDGVLNGYTINDDNGLLYCGEALIVSESIFLNYCYELQSPVPFFEVNQLIKE